MNLKALKFMLVYFVVLLLLQDLVSGLFWDRRRRSPPPPPPCPRRDCSVSEWSSWSGCSHRCGTSGVQTRTRSKTETEACGGTCPYQRYQESIPCNRYACKNGGTPIPGRCTCMPGWTGTCCESGE